MGLPKTWVRSTLAVGLFALSAGCKSAPPPEQNSPALRVALQSQHTEPVENSTAEDCGLASYPVSRSNQEILANAPPDGKEAPNSSLLAKLAVDRDGKITHIRVLRLAYANAPNWQVINDAALNDIRHLHYKPTLYNGKLVAVCTDVDVTIDLY